YQSPCPAGLQVNQYRGGRGFRAIRLLFRRVDAPGRPAGGQGAKLGPEAGNPRRRAAGWSSYGTGVAPAGKTEPTSGEILLQHQRPPAGQSQAENPDGAGD